VTASGEGPEDQERRSLKRRVDGEEEEPAAEPTYWELLDQIRSTDERYA